MASDRITILLLSRAEHTAPAPCRRSSEGDSCTMQLTEHIGLQEPLASLRGLLERRMGMELTGYEYWLQGVQQVNLAVKWIFILCC